jgi:glycosyltransferase involved in cell wall biosynthesis
VNGPTGSRPALTFFFPAYNEEANIERTVAIALEAISPLASPLEVLAIDGGSGSSTSPTADTGAP